MKEWIRRRIAGLGIEASRAATLHRFLNTRPIDLVIDAGANLGQFGRSLRLRGYKGRIWSFEPVSTVFESLRAAAAKDSAWKTSKFALGSAPGSATINVFSNHTLSSFLQGSALIDSYDGDGAPRTEVVEVETLDRLLADDPARNILLKVDVQGFERQVLEGAGKNLARIVAMHIELPVEHLYEGGWSFPEAIAYMDGLGFVPAQFRTVNALPDDPASAVEFDCLFRRKSGPYR